MGAQLPLLGVLQLEMRWLLALLLLVHVSSTVLLRVVAQLLNTE